MSLLQKSAPLAALLAMLMLSGASAPSGVSAAKSLPQLTLWAWERPEDLRFLATSHNVGVAFLAGSVYLEQQPVARPRLQPLRVGEHTPVTAVVRLEPTKSTPTVFSDEYRTRLAEQIVRLCRRFAGFRAADRPRRHAFATRFLSRVNRRCAAAAARFDAALHYRAWLVVYGR